jgi:hypothetical protein
MPLSPRFESAIAIEYNRSPIKSDESARQATSKKPERDSVSLRDIEEFY